MTGERAPQISVQGKTRETTKGRRNLRGLALARIESPSTIGREPPKSTSRENQQGSIAVSSVARQPCQDLRGIFVVCPAVPHLQPTRHITFSSRQLRGQNPAARFDSVLRLALQLQLLHLARWIECISFFRYGKLQVRNRSSPFYDRSLLEHCHTGTKFRAACSH